MIFEILFSISDAVSEISIMDHQQIGDQTITENGKIVRNNGAFHFIDTQGIPSTIAYSSQ